MNQNYFKQALDICDLVFTDLLKLLELIKATKSLLVVLD